MTQALEERLRTALRARVESYDDPVPPLMFSRPPAPTRTPVRRGRLTALVAVAASAAAAVAIGLAGADRGPRRSGVDVSAGPPPVATAPAPPPAPAATVVRILLRADGLQVMRVDEQVTIAGPGRGGPGVDGFHVQSFRSAAGFEGPMLWVLTVPPPPSERNDYGFGQGRRVTVQGSAAHVQGDGSARRLTWPAPDGGGVILSSWGLPESQLLAVAEGLRARTRAGGWDATVLPGGLAPVVDSSRADGALPGTLRRVDATYRDRSGRPVELSVYDAGPVSFEDRLMGAGMAPTLEAVTVGGRPGVLMGSAGSTSRLSLLWQPAPTMIAEVRVSPATRDDVVTREDLLAAVGWVQVVDEGAWLSSLPASTLRPPDLAAAAASMTAGTPLPPGASWTTVAVAPAARDRVAFANELLNHALCAWQQDWLAATTRGDPARAEAAVVALEASGSWPVAEVATPGATLSRGQNIASQLRAGDVDGARQYVDGSCR